MTQCQTVTDGQTDGQTDGFTIASAALSIASYADALYKRENTGKPFKAKNFSPNLGLFSGPDDLIEVWT